MGRGRTRESGRGKELWLEMYCWKNGWGRKGWIKGGIGIGMRM